jgi:UDP-N-acetylglucosamine--N-acetylmuramyl-(pentapeptide) pyrophosphoryl-undecaprenol N-acetylglucosamine transferase
VFSDIVPPALALLPENFRSRIELTQQCRAEDMARVGDAYRAAGIEADLAPFFDNIAERLANAHLVIARAGASTCAELAVAGRPAILVPLPGAIDDHQTANAAALEQSGGARVIAQKDFTPARLAEMLTQILTSPAQLSDAACAAAGTAPGDAAGSLADLVEELAMAGAGR